MFVKLGVQSYKFFLINKPKDKKNVYFVKEDMVNGYETHEPDAARMQAVNIYIRPISGRTICEKVE